MKELLLKIKEKYSIDLHERDNEIDLITVSEKKKVTISFSQGEYSAYSDVWHEHFDSIEELEKFIEGLLSGNYQIAIKYRGRTPVAHQVQVIIDGKKIVISRSGSLFSPFWKKMRIEYISYSNANKVAQADRRFAAPA